MALLKTLREKFLKQSAPVTIVVYAPEGTPAGDTVCLTGDAAELAVELHKVVYTPHGRTTQGSP